MNIAEKLATIAENMQKVFAAGKQTEYDDFWDSLQFKGNRWDYNRAFSNSCWNEKTFKPKYSLHCASCEEMFMKFNHDATFGAVDLSELDITTDKSVSFKYMFWNANVSHIPSLDMRNASDSIYNAFSWSQTAFESPLVSIDEIKIIQGIQFSKECFYRQKNLRKLILSGVLSTSIWLQDCDSLSKESIISIINAMATDNTGNSATFSKNAVNVAFETTTGAADGIKSKEWLDLISTKTNWTISILGG